MEIHEIGVNSRKRSRSNAEWITHMENGVGFSVYGLVCVDFASVLIDSEHTLWLFCHTLTTDSEFEAVIQVFIVVHLEPKE